MNKRLYVIAAMVLSLSLILAACGQGNSNAPSTASTNTPATTTDTGAATGQDNAKDNAKDNSKDNSDPVKLSVFISGSGLSDADKNIQDHIGEELGIAFDFNVMPTGSGNDYANQINVRVASGTAPDIFTISNDQMHQFTRQDLILDLTPYLDQLPNIKAAYSESDLLKGEIDNKLMALPKRASVPYRALIIRKDWLDKLGLEVPKTIADMAAVIKAFHEQDPDGNGKKDTYGYTGYGLDAFAPIFAAFGTSYGYSNASLPVGNLTVKDNQAVYTTVQPEMKEALAFIRELIASGAVDPDLLTNKGNMAPTKAQKGQVGMIYVNWSDMFKDEHVQLTKETNPEAEFIVIPAPEGPAGAYMGAFDESTADWRIALPKALADQPEKLEKALAYLDYITGQGEGQNMVMFGLEGTHYEKQGDEIVALPAMSELGTTFQLQLTGREDLPYLYSKFAKQKPYIDYAVSQPYLKVYNNFPNIPDGVNKADKDRYDNEEITKFLYGQRSLDDFDKFVETLHDTFKLQLYVDEAEAAFKARGLIQ